MVSNDTGPGVSPEALVLLAAIAAKKSRFRESDLAAELGCSDRRVRAKLQRLESAELIHRQIQGLERWLVVTVLPAGRVALGGYLDADPRPDPRPDPHPDPRPDEKFSRFGERPSHAGARAPGSGPWKKNSMASMASMDGNFKSHGFSSAPMSHARKARGPREDLSAEQLAQLAWMSEATTWKYPQHERRDFYVLRVLDLAWTPELWAEYLDAKHDVKGLDRPLIKICHSGRAQRWLAEQREELVRREEQEKRAEERKKQAPPPPAPPPNRPQTAKTEPKPPISAEKLADPEVRSGWRASIAAHTAARQAKQ